MDERTRGKDKKETMTVEKVEEDGKGNMVGKKNAQRKCGEKKEDQRSTSYRLPASLSFFFTSPSKPILCSYLVPPRPSPPPPHLFFFSPPLLPSCPLFTHLPSPLLLLTPSLVRLLIRAGGTIVPLLPVFGNPGLKQSLFTQAVAQLGPSPSLQPGQV